MTDPLHVLLLCDDHRGHANTVLDHIAAFRRWSRHRISTYNPRGLPGSLSLDLDEFDVVVIHYSIFVMLTEHLAPSFQEKLARFQGLKVQFIQDEYRWVDDVCSVMRRLGIGLVFTVVPKDEWPKIWSESRLPGVAKVPTLTGYVPDELVNRSTPPLEERIIDIGYRGREVPWWLGELGQEKIRIGQGVLARAPKYGLRCDIAWTESSRIYGEDWIRFISSCKAVLGTESGASITDFDGSIESRVARYRWEHPTADFEEVHREILAPFEENARVIAISPRMFEAAALRTAMVLFPGSYSGILTPGTHYIPLEKDFSNMDQVVEQLGDLDSLRQMVDRAHTTLVESGRYSYEAFVREFDAVLETTAWPHRRDGQVRFRLARVEAMFRTAILEGSGFLWFLRLWRRAFVALRLVLRDTGLRAILLRYFWDRRTRRLTSFLELKVDLLRFGLMCRNPGRGFRLAVAFDPVQGRLGFVSQPMAAEGSDARASRARSYDDFDVVESTLKAGRLTALIWNHSLLNDALRRRGEWIVGLGTEGIHRFRALEKLGVHSPGILSRILRSALTSASASGPLPADPARESGASSRVTSAP